MISRRGGTGTAFKDLSDLRLLTLELEARRARVCWNTRSERFFLATCSLTATLTCSVWKHKNRGRESRRSRLSSWPWNTDSHVAVATGEPWRGVRGRRCWIVGDKRRKALTLGFGNGWCSAARQNLHVGCHRLPSPSRKEISAPFHHSVEMRTIGPLPLPAAPEAPLATTAPLAAAAAAVVAADVEQQPPPLVPLASAPLSDVEPTPEPGKLTTAVVTAMGGPPACEDVIVVTRGAGLFRLDRDIVTI